MIVAARIVTEPTRVERVDGVAVYTATVEVDSGESPPPRLFTVLGGPAVGMAPSYRQGDRVWIFVCGGTSVTLCAAGDVGGDGTNNMLLARTGAASRIGALGGSGAWQALMLHTQGQQSFDLIKDTVNMIGTYVAGLLTGAGDPSGAAAVEAQLTLFAAMSGGQAAHGAQGRPS